MVPNGNYPGNTVEVAFAQGFGFFYRGPEEKLVDLSMNRWLRIAIRRQGRLRDLSCELPRGWTLLRSDALARRPVDLQRFKEMKYGRRLKGPVMLSPKEFSRREKGTGIGFKTTEMKT